MDLTQSASFLLSSGSSMPRSINNHKKRHLCFCGEELVVLSSSALSSQGRRYVACGRRPKCSFFEWIDDEEEWKSGLGKQRERRVRCFCGEVLTLRTSGITRNPNRRFISCPNRRCKFFEWVDEEDEKLWSMKVHGGTSRQRSIGGDSGNLGSQQNYDVLEAEISKLESQERKMERLSVDIEKLSLEIVQVDTCVGRLCADMNGVQEQLGRLEAT
ncbi:DNA topoisomerase 3-alpha [Stylosanthes scabra]|uniref:DNA topoisomerase 3-alpha n=1 Tax=Stylosanthes scabra TaxID=79078 RepID=A0ABU6RLF9_9FABA|nr:DNA topoisomerase 3-alpha [Stylosanthes scabra]